ncbi:MAG: shufflon system plasmid conjugative transfer pilus tip adhesin PilV [Herminiimonas sp.]|nr:shufflon system plasmid conjugative transfer pilus tip adhesin PilV [Herminiimonas sp.]
MKQRQRGITLIEVVSAMAVGSMMLAGLLTMIDNSLDDTKGQQASLYQAQIVSAVSKYIEANYGALITGTTGGASVPLNLGNLKTPAAGGNPFIAPAFANLNAYGQSPCIVVRQTLPGKLDVLIATTGGAKIAEKDLPNVAANAGQGGGYISTDSFTVAQGANWRLDAAALAPFQGGGCIAGAASDGGHLTSALFYEGTGQLSTDFLYRSAVPGRPELSTMNTPLRMAGTAVVTEGAACAGIGDAIAFNQTEDLVTCKGSIWRTTSSWKSPVASFGALPSTDQVGDVRMVLEAGYKRAFVHAGGGTWTALAVDQFGDLAVSRDLAVGQDIGAGRNMLAQNDIVASRDVEARRDLIVRTGNIWALADANAVSKYTSGLGGNGNIYANELESAGIRNGWLITESLQPTHVHAVGDRCNIPLGFGNRYGQTLFHDTIGTFVVDASREWLYCGADETFHYQAGKGFGGP